MQRMYHSSGDFLLFLVLGIFPNFNTSGKSTISSNQQIDIIWVHVYRNY